MPLYLCAYPLDHGGLRVSCGLTVLLKPPGEHFCGEKRPDVLGLQGYRSFGGVIWKANTFCLQPVQTPKEVMREMLDGSVTSQIVPRSSV